jgi:hypothetical protein
MPNARVRLVLAGLLFAVWTGWLIYQVIQSADPVVVSRPQVLVAPVIVEAHLAYLQKGPWKPQEKVRVHQILRGHETLGLPQAEQPAKLDLAVIFDDFRNPFRGWKGDGMYFLCLEPTHEGKYRLVRPPVSPGFQPLSDDEARLASIYPVTPSTRMQFEEALKDRP